MLQLSRALPHRRGQQQLATREKLDPVDVARHGALIRDGELADLVDLVAEELHAQRMRGRRREHVEDPAAHGEFAASRDHVDAMISELDEPHGDVVEVVIARAHREGHGVRVAEPGDDGLDRGADRRGDDERPLAVPRREGAERFEPTPDGLGARAQSLMRQRLPRRKLADVGRRHEGGESRRELLGAPARRDHDEQHTGLTGCLTSIDQCGERRRIESVDEREILVDRCRRERLPERFGRVEGAQDPGKTHPTSVRIL